MSTVGEYRHSLFFLSEEEAEDAKDYVDNELDDDGGLEVLESDVIEDRDEGTTTYEMRFKTQRELEEWEQRLLLQAYPPATYAFNCEDY